MDDDKVVPIRPPEVIAEAGGVVDESGATLAVYGKDLEPEDVTALLGVTPTDSFRRGYRRRPEAPPMPHGAWFLRFRGESPDGPEVQLRKLLMSLPDSEEVWDEIRKRYEARISLGLHMSNWNRGFAIPPDLIARLAKLGLELGFDIYAYGDEE